VTDAVPDARTCHSLSFGTVYGRESAQKKGRGRQKRTLRDVDEVLRDGTSEDDVRPRILLVGGELHAVPQVVLRGAAAPVGPRNENDLLEERAELIEDAREQRLDGIRDEDGLEV
jgi:hypothetical protein